MLKRDLLMNISLKYLILQTRDGFTSKQQYSKEKFGGVGVVCV